MPADTILTFQRANPLPRVEIILPGKEKLVTKPTVSKSTINGKFVSRLENPPPLPKPKPVPGVRSDPKPIIPILSFDGGGSRGVYSLEIALQLEAALRVKLNQPTLKLTDAVKFVAGTSVGGIIALGLQEMSAADLSAIFDQNIPEIFKRTIISDLDYYFRDKPKYTRDKLNALAQQLFNGKLAKYARLPFAVATCQLNAEASTRIITREHTAEGFFEDWSYQDVADATSAAPTYFAPFEKNDDSFTDGGMALNNPEVAAWIEANTFYGPDNDFVLCSIGTCVTPTPLNTAPDKSKFGWGWFTWVDDTNVLNAVLNDTSTAAAKEMHDVMLGTNRYFRIQTQLSKNIPLDTTDPKELAELRQLANNWIAANQDQWNNLIDLICQAWNQQPKK